MTTELTIEDYLAFIDKGKEERKALALKWEALIDTLTEEEQDALARLRSLDWCGTNWETKFLRDFKKILDARNTTPILAPMKQQHPLKKLFSFLFS